MEMSPASTRVSEADQRLAVFLWGGAATILSFLALVHLGVLLCLLTSHAALPWVVPAAFVVAVWLGDFLGRREGLRGRDRAWQAGWVLGLTLLATGISAAFYDLSWDGQWYHQPAVYSMIQGWSPLAEPAREFAEHNQLWIRHYAKGPWYIATAMATLTGQIETGKFQTWMTMGAAFAAVSAVCLEAGFRRARALAVGCVVALNPVVLSEFLSSLVDGLTVSYLACCMAALFSGLHRPRPLIVLAGAAATVGCINAKFTGLILLCMLGAATGFYWLLRRKVIPWRWAQWNLMAIVLGAVVFGYNPYVTNTIHWSNPFYPLAGSKAFPSLAEQGNDPIERDETPPNLQGRPRFVRLSYAIFGRPGFSPYNGEPQARLMWPFGVHLQDLAVYRFHDVRIAGLGPLFSGGVVLALVLTAWLFLTPNTPRLLLLFGYGAVIATLLISVHMWWARYSPQAWWLPILPAAAVFWKSTSRWQVLLAWTLLGLLLVNTLIVATVRVHWEVVSTRTLHRQLVDLQNSGKEIEVDLMFYGGSVGERLRARGIAFEPTRLRRRAEGVQELMSVAKGNPGSVLYRVKPSPPSNVSNGQRP